MALPERPPGDGLPGGPGECPNPGPGFPDMPDDDRMAFILFLILLLLVLIF